jgi:hypothetical protein
MHYVEYRCIYAVSLVVFLASFPSQLRGQVRAASERRLNNVLLEPKRAAEAAIQHGIEPTHVEGLPNGMRLRALVTWMHRSGRVTPPDDLVVNIVAYGNGTDAIIGYGIMQIGELASDPRERLRLIDVSRETGDGYAGHVWIRRGPAGHHPENGIWLPIGFRRPHSAVTRIAKLKMQFTLERARSSREVAFRDLDPAVETRVEDAELMKRRLLIRPDTGRSSVRTFGWRLEFLHRPEQMMKSLTARDGSGTLIARGYASYPDRFFGRDWASAFVSGVGDWPADGSLNVEFADVESLPVSAEFDNLVVPAASALSAADARLEAWRPAVVTQGLPADLIVDGGARWSRELGPIVERNLPRLDLEFRGPPARNIAAIGFLQLESVLSDKGPLETMLRSERDEMRGRWMDIRDVRQGDQPPDGTRMSIHFSPGDVAHESIKSAAGSVAILTAELRDITFPHALSRNGQILDDPALDAAGVKLRLLASPARFACELLEGDIRNVDSIDLVDEAGVPFHGHVVPLSPLPFERSEIMINVLPLELFRERHPDLDLATVGVKLGLRINITETTIPFRFEDLPFPPPPTYR